MNAIIKVDHLCKSYGTLPAVSDISFHVETGQLFSFLGPNGAGKSTTINILCTLLSHDSGNVTIDGHSLQQDSQAIRRNIGIVFQESVLDPLLTVRENLRIRGRFYTSDRRTISRSIDRVSAMAGLEEFIDRPFGRLSGGQRRRADIARALIHTPKLLFLDEPTTGLDPQTRRNIWDTIRHMQSDTGMTIFLTTHYMEEAAQSDYVVVMDHGQIAANGTPSQLRSRYSCDLLKLYAPDGMELEQRLTDAGIRHTRQAGEYTVKLDHTLSALPVLTLCQDSIQGFQVLQGSMDDAFLGIIGKELLP